MLQIALARATEAIKPKVRDAIAECRKQQSQGNSPNSLGITPPTNGPTPTAPTQTEIVLWKSIENSTNANDFKSYLDTYPSGAFAPLARGYYQRACDGGDAQACSRLGDIFIDGRGVAKDEIRATQLYCDSGDGQKCFTLAEMYDSGQGVAKDQNRAVQLYQRACEKGESQSCSHLRPFYEKACGAGDGQRCTSLGSMYENGRGVTKDVNRALEYYQKACDGGDARGCTNLGFR